MLVRGSIKSVPALFIRVIETDRLSWKIRLENEIHFI